MLFRSETFHGTSLLNTPALLIMGDYMGGALTVLCVFGEHMGAPLPVLYVLYIILIIVLMFVYYSV